jgi:hypothetical protein
MAMGDALEASPISPIQSSGYGSTVGLSPLVLDFPVLPNGKC